MLTFPQVWSPDPEFALAGAAKRAFAAGSRAICMCSSVSVSTMCLSVTVRNLACTAPISMTKAALGGDIHIPIIGGGQAKVRVPPGSQTGKRMRLTGKGMPSVRGSARNRGDLYVELFVETPVNLTEEQKRLLRKFEELGDDGGQHEDSLGDRVKSFWRN